MTDLVFLINAQPSNFVNIRDAMKAAIAKYGTNEIKYGIVVYGSTATTKLRLRDRIPNDEVLKRLIDDITLNTGIASLSRGLEEAKTLFDGLDMSRKDARKILVVITDTRTGTNKDAIQREIRDIYNKDVRVIPVAIGGDALRDLDNDFKEVDVVVVKGDENPKKMATTIMKNVTSGKLLLRLQKFSPSLIPSSCLALPCLLQLVSYPLHVFFLARCTSYPYARRCFFIGSRCN